MSNACVTVLMPCAGNGEYFEQAFLSAINQSHEAIRIKVLDNASPTNLYKEICDRHADTRVDYVRFEERLPMPENWQRCLQFAGDGCFCFLHDDDVWPDGYLSSSVERLFASDDTIAVLTRHMGFSHPIEMQSKPDTEGKWTRFHSSDPLTKHAMMILGDWGHMSALLFKKNLFSFDTNSFWNPDQRLFHAYALAGCIECSLAAPVWIRCHDGNITSASRSIRNMRERDEFAKRELISQMGKPMFKEALHAVAASDCSSAYRLAKAVYSWPIDPALVSWSKPIFDDKSVSKKIRSHSIKGRLMSAPGTWPKIFSSLLIDMAYLWKARALFKRHT